MERKANNFEEAQQLFLQDPESPVLCSKEGADDLLCNTELDAAIFFEN